MSKATNKETIVRTDTYAKCPTYWCRFCNGAFCTLKDGDPMKEAVCILDDWQAFDAASKKRIEKLKEDSTYDEDKKGKK